MERGRPINPSANGRLWMFGRCVSGRRFGWLTIVTLGVFATPPALAGSVSLVPSDLNPGDTYHLAFVTSTTRNATSTNIADYDSFVQARANAAGNGLNAFTWRAIGSTALIDAATHLELLGPIYRLDGVRIADSEADLFDASLTAPLNLNELGHVNGANPVVWTGTDALGAASAPGGTNASLGAQRVTFGRANDVTGHWIDSGEGTIQSSLPAFIYAVSEPIVVAEPVPSLDGAGLFWIVCLLGCAGLATLQRRRA